MIVKGKLAVITGPDGNLGPVWRETCEDMGMLVHGLGMPTFDIRDKQLVQGVKSILPDLPSLLVCNAAIDNAPGGASGFWDNYEQIIEVNLKGHLHLLSSLLPYHVDHPCLVIFVGSMLGHSGADWRRYRDIGLKDFTKPIAYGLTKAAFIQAARAITTEYGHLGIRGVCLSFGPVDTGKFNPEFGERIKKDIPLGRLVQKADLKAALKFAIECDALAGTQDVFVDGGILSW